MNIKEILKTKILVLDGAMGTMVQRYNLQEEDYKGKRFANHPALLKGNNDILNITKPDIIKAIHKEYLEAGADIIETNSFNANKLSQADYELEDIVYELNFEAAQIAKAACNDIEKVIKDKPRFVAGSLGPTGKTASISPSVNNPAERNITFDELVATYAEATRGLIEGGVDLLLIETVFDTLNCKAAIYAIEEVMEELGVEIPVVISGTISDASGRTLSGQTALAFMNSVSHCSTLLSIGFNCALGAEDMRPHINELSNNAPVFINAHPNAGLPNEFGEYDQSPDDMAKLIKGFVENKYLNIIGGCCGTTPQHIKAIAEIVKDYSPRTIPTLPQNCQLSGLEMLSITPETNFINVGERANVAGSRKFLRLIKEESYDEALSIVRQQVENGAQIIDVNMDDAMLDSVDAMTTFLNLIASEPDICKVPIMIDSSKWEVLEAGLKVVQGKGIVNSISLKEGIEAFIDKAKLVKRYGAAVLVMAFDEKGQADTVERRVTICKKSYDILLTLGFLPQEIIFDPNIFAIATGIEEHNAYAADFIVAVAEIKKQCPGCLISGGVSNVSFSFRGNNGLREMIHSVFLYHAIHAGMDMGIVNAGQLTVYADIPKEHLKIVEDAVLNRTDNAAEELLSIASNIQSSVKENKADLSWRESSCEERITHAMVRGITDYIIDDVKEAMKDYEHPIQVIEIPLMNGMKRVGSLFGKGEMFLPQVVKSARVMKQAVSYLQPFIEESNKLSGNIATSGKIVLATVKGDVHDIGKNIVKVILQCNNYEVIDIGVMVPCETILQTAKDENADVIALSGLITPSLEEMTHIAKEMDRQNFDIPLLIGGATTSALHTAVKIAPEYDGAVVYVKDASHSIGIVSSILNKINGENYIKELKEDQSNIREISLNKSKKKSVISIEDARKNKFILPADYTPFTSNFTGINIFYDYSLAQIAEYIDWAPFFWGWDLKGKFPEILEKEAAKSLYDDAQIILSEIIANKSLTPKATIGIFKAQSKDESVTIQTDKGEFAFTFPRQLMHKPQGYKNYSLADFISSNKDDYMGVFAVTTGHGIEELLKYYNDKNDDYSALIVSAIGDRLVEAFTELLHERVRKEFWGYAKDENLTKEELLKVKYEGIRPAPGYPSCPNHSDKEVIFDILSVQEKIGIGLTENYSMTPAQSVSGFFFANKDAKYFTL